MLQFLDFRRPSTPTLPLKNGDFRHFPQAAPRSRYQFRRALETGWRPLVAITSVSQVSPRPLPVELDMAAGTG
jgi:hypothetical protein